MVVQRPASPLGHLPRRRALGTALPRAIRVKRQQRQQHRLRPPKPRACTTSSATSAIPTQIVATKPCSAAVAATVPSRPTALLGPRSPVPSSPAKTSPSLCTTPTPSNSSPWSSSPPSGGRSVWLATSRDFDHFTEPELIFHADETDWENCRQRVRTIVADPAYITPPIVDDEDYHAEIYNMAIMPYQGLYIGLPHRLQPHRRHPAASHQFHPHQPD